MNLASLIPPWIFFSLVIVNSLMFVSSFLMGYEQLATLNVLSAACCYIGYRVSLASKKEK